MALVSGTRLAGQDASRARTAPAKTPTRTLRVRRRSDRPGRATGRRRVRGRARCRRRTPQGGCGSDSGSRQVPITNDEAWPPNNPRGGPPSGQRSAVAWKRIASRLTSGGAGRFAAGKRATTRWRRSWSRSRTASRAPCRNARTGTPSGRVGRPTAPKTPGRTSSTGCGVRGGTHPDIRRAGAVCRPGRPYVVGNVSVRQRLEVLDDGNSGGADDPDQPDQSGDRRRPLGAPTGGRWRRWARPRCWPTSNAGRRREGARAARRPVRCVGLARSPSGNRGPTRVG